MRSGAKIHFGPRDGEGVQATHNDALVITARVGGYNVRRILIDSGSTMDIITLACLRKMDIWVELKADQTMLIGFNNCRAGPCREIHLPVNLGGSRVEPNRDSEVLSDGRGIKLQRDLRKTVPKPIPGCDLEFYGIATKILVAKERRTYPS